MVDLFFKTISGVWPMILIVTIIIISIRLTYLLYNRKKIILHKELIMLIFIIYILLLYYIVTFQDSNYGTNNFIPFKEMFRYNITSPLFFKNVIGNVVLFIPLGLFVTLYIKNKTFILTLILSIIISLSIEFIQSMIGRTMDIDDVILNATGGILGYFICKAIDKTPKFMKNSLFLDILSLIFILVIIYVAFKFKFWRYFV